MIPERDNPIDTNKKQYGTALVYGSIFPSAGGSVVQSIEIVASNKPAYEKPKSQR